MEDFLLEVFKCILVLKYRQLVRKLIRQRINSHHKNMQKVFNKENRVKYQQFIQDLQNSSHSSIDYEGATHRSFRDSKQNDGKRRALEEPNQKRVCQKTFKSKKYDSKEFCPISVRENQNQNEEQLQDKLYTFCDVKKSERSVEIPLEGQITDRNIQQYRSKVNRIGSVCQPKQVSQSKSCIQKNCNAAHKSKSKNCQISPKIKEGFEGKFLKTESELAEKPQTIIKMLEDNQAGEQKITSNPTNDWNLNPNSVRKIESVKKFEKADDSKKKGSSIIKAKSRQSDTDQKQKSSENSNIKNGSSSKKKIVSLNIKKLKPENGIKSRGIEQQMLRNNQTRKRLKLSVSSSVSSMHSSTQHLASDLKDGSCLDREERQFKKNKGLTSDEKIRVEDQFQEQIFTHSLNCSKELGEQSVILNDKELKFLLRPDPQVLQNSRNREKSDFKRQSSAKVLNSNGNLSHKVCADSLSLQNLISEQALTIKELKHELSESQQNVLKVTSELREIEILKRDSVRLMNSYRDVKNLYQQSIEQKEKVEFEASELKNENTDLKQCLDFKEGEIEKLTFEIQNLTKALDDLQAEAFLNDNNNHKFPKGNSLSLPKNLQGLGAMIRDKIQAYENEVSALLDQNTKLNLLREKLEKYNETLKQEIEDRDEYIRQLQQQNIVSDSLKNSYRHDFVEQKSAQNKLTKIIKELEGKLKLTAIHNDYLTNELCELKDQIALTRVIDKEPKNQQQLQPKEGDSVQINELSENRVSQRVNRKVLEKISNENYKLAKTITTRNSSICQNHFRDLDSRVTEDGGYD